MRTTWLILVLMLLIGGIMYFLAQKPQRTTVHNTIAFGNTPDSIRQRTILYVAYDPAQVYFRDSAWSTADSTPLKIIPPDSALSAFNGHGSATFYIDYNHQYFYDIEISKPATGQPFGLTLDLQPDPANNTVQLSGVVDSQNGKLDFSGPMMKMFNAFVLSYNTKIPDSLRSADSSLAKAEKLITVIRK
ncbi:MAG: hypothetical protein J7578_06350 [Chitinophagaceae bacterium]|nr:hypothetical protein [Chitinophagaceae bacterium]